MHALCSISPLPSSRHKVRRSVSRSISIPLFTAVLLKANQPLIGSMGPFWDGSPRATRLPEDSTGRGVRDSISSAYAGLPGTYRLRMARRPPINNKPRDAGSGVKVMLSSRAAPVLPVKPVNVNLT
jgi:hypothetical protein